MPPALSLRELIFQDVETTLEGISVANGYATNIGTIGRGNIPPLETSTLPIAAILPASDEPTPTPQTSRRALTFVIRVWIDTAQPNTATALEALIADIQQALQVDPYRDGHAENTLDMTLQYIYVQHTETLAGADIGVQVDYKTSLTSPRVDV